jgi:hypothetical protein
MGHSNSLCSITKIPVAYNQRVVQVFLGMNQRNMSSAARGTPWAPICLPIRGTYNPDYYRVDHYPDDYGNTFLVKDIIPLFGEVTLNTDGHENCNDVFFAHSYCRRQSMPSSWAHGKQCEYKTVEFPFGGKSLQKVRGNGTAVGLAFVHMDAWDHLVSLLPVDIEEQIAHFIDWRTRVLEVIEQGETADQVADHEKLRSQIEKIIDEKAKNISLDDKKQLLNEMFSNVEKDYKIDPPDFFWNAFQREPVYGSPIDINVADIIASKVDRYILGELSLEDVKPDMLGLIELIQFFNGSGEIYQFLEPTAIRCGQEQETKECLVKLEFNALAGKIQTEILLSRFRDKDGSYDFSGLEKRDRETFLKVLKIHVENTKE